MSHIDLISNKVKTIGTALLILGTLAVGVHNVMSLPKQVDENTEAIQAVNTKVDQVADELGQFVVEQRVAVAENKKAAEMTQDTMRMLAETLRNHP